MAHRVPGDKTNGYEEIAEEFMLIRTTAKIGASIVSNWAATFREGSAILDLGCGHGIPVAQELVRAGLVVYGIDASSKMIAAFQATFPDAPAECGAVEDSAFFGRPFDGVVACGLMFLLPSGKQSTLIRKVAKALNPGGRFIFTSPYQPCEWSDTLTGRRSVSLGAQAYQGILDAEGLEWVGEQWDEGDNHYYLVSKP